MSEQETAAVARTSESWGSVESMNLQPGMRLQVLMHRSHKAIQHISAVIGFEADQYLLIKQPRDSRTWLTFIDGEKLSVRVFSGTSICTFDCTVIKTFAQPLNCLCISYPPEVRVKQLRREMRIKVAIAAKAKASVGDVTTEMVNLSATGCLLRAAQSLGEVDSLINLSFPVSLDGSEAMHEITTRAKVRNVLELEPGSENGFAIGLEFTDLDPTSVLMLRNHVYESLLDSRQNIV